MSAVKEQSVTATYWQTADGKTWNVTRWPTPTCWACISPVGDVTRQIDEHGETQTMLAHPAEVAFNDPQKLSARCTGCGRIWYREVGTVPGVA